MKNLNEAIGFHHIKAAQPKMVYLRYLWLRNQSTDTTIQIIDKKMRYCTCVQEHTGLVREMYKLKQFWQKKKLWRIGHG